MNEILTVTGILILFFSFGWFHSIKTNKFAWIDFYWVAGFPIVVIFLFSFGSRPLNLNSQSLFSILVLIWSARLGSMLFQRIRSHDEDARYLKLKKHWGASSARNFYILYLAEGLLVVTLLTPLFIIYFSEPTSLSFWNMAGAILFALAFLGETISDWQLNQFKKKNAGQKKVCDVGFWRYSRHPNYFFEIMIWFSYGIFIIELSPLGFVPFLLMAFLISKVTGVPHAEEQALQTRGELYRQYQKTTSVLIPWFPKKGV